jgi:ABC-2 type transport system ATP-binding protein
MSLLQVSNLSIKYPKTVKRAVDDISFVVNPGEVLGILGGNGAGKTSSLKAIAGLLPCEPETMIELNNSHLNNVSQREYVRSLIGYCPDTGGVIRQATVEDHLEILLTNKKNVVSRDQAYGVIEHIGLGDFLKQEAGSFSHGMSRRLAVALATLSAEKLLILDEPFDGVDPLGVEAIQDIIDEARRNSLAVIVSTHLLSLLAKTSDRILVMNKGRLVVEDSASSFLGEDANERYSAILKQDNQRYVPR